jgi:hypothetical protein
VLDSLPSHGSPRAYSRLDVCTWNFMGPTPDPIPQTTITSCAIHRDMIHTRRYLLYIDLMATSNNAYITVTLVTTVTPKRKKHPAVSCAHGAFTPYPQTAPPRSTAIGRSARTWRKYGPESAYRSHIGCPSRTFFPSVEFRWSLESLLFFFPRQPL